jgi:hypothetical protein
MRRHARTARLGTGAAAVWLAVVAATGAAYPAANPGRAAGPVRQGGPGVTLDAAVKRPTRRGRRLPRPWYGSLARAGLATPPVGSAGR